eukprot:TRINITY_DN10176_c0_g1_i2.p2 TRINITY_DN10176_c0_g1~~TRINITY_DN10176_c0_g1_i2.p2  ORF type:complete len:190 (+),score=22.53 TRINITY_DN10176_c0_g1_i2:169-738(+)
MIQRLLSPLSILQIRKVTLNCGAMAASAVRLKSSGGQKPAVGVAAVVLRKSSADRLNPEVLMIQRGKEPKKGYWSFPGGRLELGETMAQCAKRELKEETCLDVSVQDHVVTVIDVITYENEDASKALDYHYVVVDLLAFGDGTPKASDDVLDARWIAMSDVTATVPCHDGIEDAIAKLRVQLPALSWPN